MELVITTTFGLEAIAKRELISLGFNILSVEDGHITVESDLNGIAKANINLRTADRVYLKMGSFTATTFNDLFEQTKALDWTEWLTEDAKFTVNGSSVKSTLFSISDCQAIVKKAVVEKMKEKYPIEVFPETGAVYTIKVSLLRDKATLLIDTTGPALHKRGYRTEAVIAPIKETMAAALVLLSYWRDDRTLYDPFCGSGTIGIEAALIGKNIAPGLNRTFACSDWPQIHKYIWDQERDWALSNINDKKLDIKLSDVNDKAVAAAIKNVENAGVSDSITVKQADAREVDYKNDHSIIITNPPYGQRLDEKINPKLKSLYRDFGRICKSLTNNSKYIITSFPGFENLFEKKADRIRVLFNGNVKARYYQYYGPRPEKK